MTAFPYMLSDQPDTLPVMGLVVLQSDETIEQDFRRLLPGGDVALHVTRVPSAETVSGETLATMRDALPDATRLLPRARSFDVVGYGCTSGTSVIGPDTIHGLVRDACTVRHVTEPLSALVAACKALGVSRLAFLSPYIAEVSSTLRDALAERGVESPVFGSFDEAEEAKVSRIAPASIVDAAEALCGTEGTDAIFLSCTNLRTLDVIAEIEARTGKPVLSSNQVLAWHMAQLAGVEGVWTGSRFLK